MARTKKVVPEVEVGAVATALFKFQNFKPEVVKQRVSSKYYEPASIVALHSYIRRFIATGQANLEKAPAKVYDVVKECINNHVQPLRPSEREKARPYVEHNRKQKSKITVTKSNPLSDIQKEHNRYSTKLDVSNIKKQQTKTVDPVKSNIKYGVLVDNKIVNMFNTNTELDAYAKALVDFNISNYQLVKLSFEKI